MIANKEKQFIEIESHIKELFEQIEQLKLTSQKSAIDLTDNIVSLEDKLEQAKVDLIKKLTPWQRVQLSRHPDRPYAIQYINHIFTDFVELHGDKGFGDDKALIAGFANLNDHPIMILGQQKGHDTPSRQKRNFGMMNPEGYRKALRLMKLAEKFNVPVITFIDTPGAYPGLGAEERGQGEAIARNIYEMIRLKVPIICVVIGEGASGGALGIGTGDKIFMLENTWFTVISPESCSSILWRNWENKEIAAEQLRLTPKEMFSFKLIDGVIPEPKGGAHWNWHEACNSVKKKIVESLKELQKIKPEKRIKQRIEKYSKMCVYVELKK